MTIWPLSNSSTQKSDGLEFSTGLTTSRAMTHPAADIAAYEGTPWFLAKQIHMTACLLSSGLAPRRVGIVAPTVPVIRYKTLQAVESSRQKLRLRCAKTMSVTETKSSVSGRWERSAAVATKRIGTAHIRKDIDLCPQNATF